jgi:hypothetical protein
MGTDSKSDPVHGVEAFINGDWKFCKQPWVFAYLTTWETSSFTEILGPHASPNESQAYSVKAM